MSIESTIKYLMLNQYKGILYHSMISVYVPGIKIIVN